MQKTGHGSALAQRIFRGPGRTACCTILTGFYFDMCQSTCVGETASWALLCAVPRRCSNKKLHVSTRRALFDKRVWPASHHAPAMMASAACVDAVWRRLLWRKQITYFVSENLALQRTAAIPRRVMQNSKIASIPDFSNPTPVDLVAASIILAALRKPGRIMW